MVTVFSGAQIIFSGLIGKSQLLLSTLGMPNTVPKFEKTASKFNIHAMICFDEIFDEHENK